MDIGLISSPRVGEAARFAKLVERLGFESLAFTDSQVLQPDAWGQLFLAAQATRKIRIGTGVTNPVTRHCSVTASALVSLQIESAGRAFCGIGRGASATESIGQKPAPLADFEAYLTQLSAYIDPEPGDSGARSVRLPWTAEYRYAKPPIEIAATGPRMMGIAAKYADSISFCLGANPERLKQALERTKSAAVAHGRNPDSIRYGAFINCVIHEDAAAARDAVRGSLAVFAMTNARDAASLPDSLRPAAANLLADYRVDQSGLSSATHARKLPDAFIDWFGIACAAAEAEKRFRELSEIGLDYVRILPGSTDSPPEMATSTLMTLSRSIIPAVQ